MRFENQTPYWLLAFSILIGLTLPVLIQDGMFMDAMLYTSVSHNLSQGIGTFWFPQFSEHNLAGLSSFHEQPPLVFGIQAIFYVLFGDSMYVERLYTFIVLSFTAWLIVLLWKEIFRNSDTHKGAGWLPLILWITVPVCFWSYSNNMHENTMGVFTLLAVLLSYKAVSRYSIFLLLLSGGAVLLATLSKGIPGFFPLGVPVLFWLVTRKISLSKALLHTAIIAFVPVVGYTVLFLIPESRVSLSLYLFERALSRISEVPTVDSRFFILGRLFMELIPQLALVVLLYFIGRKKKTVHTGHIREAVFFVLVGLSGSAPLMLTLVQKGFYFVPSLPFFAIGFGILVIPVITELTSKIKKHRAVSTVSGILLVSVIVFSATQIGKSNRNKELLHDVYVIGETVPGPTTVSVLPEMWNEWDLQCYLIRYFNISMETGFEKEYCVINRSLNQQPPGEYRKVNIETVQWDLYRR